MTLPRRDIICHRKRGDVRLGDARGDIQVVSPSARDSEELHMAVTLTPATKPADEELERAADLDGSSLLATRQTMDGETSIYCCGPVSWVRSE